MAVAYERTADPESIVTNGAELYEAAGALALPAELSYLYVSLGASSDFGPALTPFEMPADKNDVAPDLPRAS